jgi:hypothetical protein
VFCFAAGERIGFPDSSRHATRPFATTAPAMAGRAGNACSLLAITVSIDSRSRAAARGIWFQLQTEASISCKKSAALVRTNRQ